MAVANTCDSASKLEGSATSCFDSGRSAAPDFPKVFTQLQLDSLEKLPDSVSFPDHHFPAMASAVPVAVGDLQRLILHYLSASKHTSQSTPGP